MIYLRARYYDPSTGQFISRDPLVGLTRQPYAYVGDNPLNGTDPLGLFGFAPSLNWGSIGGGFAGGLGAVGQAIGDVAVGVTEAAAAIGDAAIVIAGTIVLPAAALAVGATILTAPTSYDDGGAMARAGQMSMASGKPSCPYPGTNVTQPPAAGWNWRGNGTSQSGQGNWVSPDGKEMLHPDLQSRSHGPHRDYQDESGKYRWYPNGTITPK